VELKESIPLVSLTSTLGAWQDVLVLDGGVVVGKHLSDVLDLHR
jgi:hypothetical protein